MTPEFTRDDVLRLLEEVGEILHAEGIEAVLYIVGGAAMSLEYSARRITRDVDAAIREHRSEFWAAARTVAERRGIDPEWVNTSAAAFMSNEEDTDAHEITLPGLRVTVASPEHLIAMKLRSLRERDMDDLEALFRIAGITEPAEAAAIHDRLFDSSYIGYHSPEESLYAAQRVFDRAAALGRPLA